MLNNIKQNKKDKAHSQDKQNLTSSLPSLCQEQRMVPQQRMLPELERDWVISDLESNMTRKEVIVAYFSLPLFTVANL
jgi:hypothetical protein